MFPFRFVFAFRYLLCIRFSRIERNRCWESAARDTCPWHFWVHASTCWGLPKLLFFFWHRQNQFASGPLSKEGSRQLNHTAHILWHCILDCIMVRADLSAVPIMKSNRCGHSKWQLRGANSERVRNRVCTGAAHNPNFKSSANFLSCSRCRRCSGGPFIAAVLNRSWAGIYKTKFIFGTVISEFIPNLIRGFSATVYAGKSFVHCLKISVIVWKLIGVSLLKAHVPVFSKCKKI